MKPNVIASSPEYDTVKRVKIIEKFNKNQHDKIIKLF